MLFTEILLLCGWCHQPGLDLGNGDELDKNNDDDVLGDGDAVDGNFSDEEHAVWHYATFLFCIKKMFAIVMYFIKMVQQQVSNFQVSNCLPDIMSP